MPRPHPGHCEDLFLYSPPSILLSLGWVPQPLESAESLRDSMGAMAEIGQAVWGQGPTAL